MTGFGGPLCAAANPKGGAQAHWSGFDELLVQEIPHPFCTATPANPVVQHPTDTRHGPTARY
jgi:hypothetical protein